MLTRRYVAIVFSALIIAIAGKWYSASGDTPRKDTADVPGVAFVEVGETYHVRMLTGVPARFQVVWLSQEGDFAIVKAVGLSGTDIPNGTTWYINLKQVPLVEYKKPRK